MLREVREARAQEGYSLVELVVVVIILGILAAIAIALFLHQREKARDAAAESDLRNLATAQEAYYIDFDTYAAGAETAATDTILAPQGLRNSGDVLYCTAPAGGDTFVAAAIQRHGTVIYHWDGTWIQRVEHTTAAPHDDADLDAYC